MAQDLTLQTIDSQKNWLDPASEKVQNAVNQAYESAGPAGQKVKDFLHGTWMGHPFHSAVTDVPIGAWTCGVVMDAMGEISGNRDFDKAADTAIAIGLAGAAVAAAAGITDWASTHGTARRVGATHGLMNVAGVLLYSASLAARRRGDRGRGRGLSTMGFLMSMGAAFLGGKLVYTERLGVDHTQGQKLPEGFTDVAADAEVREGELKRVEVEGTGILLTRSKGQVYALNEVCPRMGGQLSEGTSDGCTLTCPWHGSKFALKDGSVVNGPAVHPAPDLEVRVREGRIEVRRG
jgi:nitrite reductase/ring-hydroxylating ferredoxin subunit/uncharacterized membrane protein